MKSFRTELEDPWVERDIIDLEKKIFQFKSGRLDEDSFRSLRLARGVYGQRQPGVQMIRIKIPLGVIRPAQLRRIAEISDTYSNGNIHLTTRQDIQIHYVSLDDTPQLWAELERDDITLREACGNTVRNITASHLAGVDRNEPFDITHYGWSLFRFFLRNPVGEEMGRKFKIAFSSAESDLARTYMHDLGLIPKIRNGIEGFKVVIGGGLGAQPALAITIKEFLPASQLLHLSEAIVRVFDQYGERNKRHKARFKFLIKELGEEEIVTLIENEFQNTIQSNYQIESKPPYQNSIAGIEEEIIAKPGFGAWEKTNVIDQKQAGFKTVFVKVSNGNLTTNQTRILADIIERFSPEEARLTIDQNLVIRSIRQNHVIALYNALYQSSFADYGANSILDITSCPGTLTCNLGITSGYGVSDVIQNLLKEEYGQLIPELNLQIKISGCMNSCGQHVVPDIGFHGSTIRTKEGTLPALQVLLGGFNKGDGEAQLADKIIKIPSKRVESVIRYLLDDYLSNRKSESFNVYYNNQGKHYFYDLLKPLADVQEINESDFIDWGSESKYQKAIGVGECAGVRIDLVKTLLYEAYDKIENARYFLEHNQSADAIYSTYSSVIQSAKAFLVKKGENTNSKASIVNGFEFYYDQIKSRFLAADFETLIADLLQPEHTAEKAKNDVERAVRFHLAIDELTNEEV